MGSGAPFVRPCREEEEELEELEEATTYLVVGYRAVPQGLYPTVKIFGIFARGDEARRRQWRVTGSRVVGRGAKQLVQGGGLVTWIKVIECGDLWKGVAIC